MGVSSQEIEQLWDSRIAVLGGRSQVAEGNGEAWAVERCLEDAGVNYCGLDVPSAFFSR